VTVGTTLNMTEAVIPFVPTTLGRTPHAHLSRADPGPVRLSVSLTWLGRRSVVLVEGDLDVDTTIAFEPAFEQLIGSGFDEVVLDVNKVRHVDESGAVVLAELWTQLRNEGIICRVRGLPPECADSPLELLFSVRAVDPVDDSHKESP